MRDQLTTDTLVIVLLTRGVGPPIIHLEGFGEPGARPRMGLSRLELIELVGRIQAAEGTDDEITEWMSTFEDAVPLSGASGLIFWADLTPAGVVDRALAFEPPPLPAPGRPVGEI
jgi:hypothetical protein